MIRYVDRTVSQLTPGDRFSLNDGATYHVCAVNVCWSGSIAVYADPDAPRVDTADTIQLSVQHSQVPCRVEVETVRVSVPWVLDVDVKNWAREYGVEAIAGAVRSDVKAYFSPEKAIPEHLQAIVWAKNSQPPYS